MLMFQMPFVNRKPCFFNNSELCCAIYKLRLNCEMQFLFVENINITILQLSFAIDVMTINVVSPFNKSKHNFWN